MTPRSSARPGALATLAIVVGAAGSLYFMIRVGSRNPSLLLMLMFAVWVTAPFIGLLVAQRRMGGRAAPAILDTATLGIVLGSLIIYQRVLTHPPVKAAFPFLVVPLASWLVIAGAVGAAYLVSRKHG